MYLKSFKIKYPEPSYAFLGKELVPYLEKHPNDKEAVDFEYWFANDFDFKITKPLYWRVRKRVATWRDDNYYAYVTSPESETYWCS